MILDKILMRKLTLKTTFLNELSYASVSVNDKMLQLLKRLVLIIKAYNSC